MRLYSMKVFFSHLKHGQMFLAPACDSQLLERMFYFYSPHIFNTESFRTPWHIALKTTRPLKLLSDLMVGNPVTRVHTADHSSFCFSSIAFSWVFHCWWEFLCRRPFFSSPSLDFVTNPSPTHDFSYPLYTLSGHLSHFHNFSYCLSTVHPAVASPQDYADCLLNISSGDTLFSSGIVTPTTKTG